MQKKTINEEMKARFLKKEIAVRIDGKSDGQVFEFLSHVLKDTESRLTKSLPQKRPTHNAVIVANPLAHSIEVTNSAGFYRSELFEMEDFYVADAPTSKKTIKPEMLAKFKAGEIYVDAHGDLQGVRELISDALNIVDKLPFIEFGSGYFYFVDGQNSWNVANNPRLSATIIPLSEMYETAEDEFVIQIPLDVEPFDKFEDVEVSDSGSEWVGNRKYICRVPNGTPCSEKGFGYITIFDGYPETWTQVRRPIRKQTVTLEELIATYAEKHGIAPEVITVDNN